MSKSKNRYKQLIEKIFLDQFSGEENEIQFQRLDIETTASKLQIELPKNVGDIIYSFRYRTSMPNNILKHQPEGMEWIIEGAGKGKYRFKLVKINRIIPNEQLIKIKIPNSTPEIVSMYALSDEQALLAKVRYNRLIDIFLGLTTFSLQTHLRTTVKKDGQIEIDEIYVGINQSGYHYIIPVQAKGGNDQLSVVQTKQDIQYCKDKYPNLICKAISTQFIEDNVIAMFQLIIQNEELKIVEERHYQLVPSHEISNDDLKQYKTIDVQN